MDQFECRYIMCNARLNSLSVIANHLGGTMEEEGNVKEDIRIILAKIAVKLENIDKTLKGIEYNSKKQFGNTLPNMKQKYGNILLNK